MITQHPIKNILITGCSSGLGRVTALHLAQRGWRVIAGVRKDADAQSIVSEARALNIQDLATLNIDVTHADSIARATTDLAQLINPGTLAAIVNNAGTSVVGPLELVPLSEWRRQFEINVFGQIAVTQALLPMLRDHVRAKGRGTARVVMMSSVAGKVSQPMLGPYCASKFALEAISDALRMELAPQGIQVSLIEPGAFESNIWGKGKSSADAMDRAHPAFPIYDQMLKNLERGVDKVAKHPAIAVARAVERALTRSKAPARILVGTDAKAGAISKWLLPTRLFDFALRKTYGVPNTVELAPKPS
ncbi:MAG: SDR family oxidoreductase [Phycisphaerales bacterium]|nr:SDR family oxidoreductase [Phycisphaerales bacterium]